MTSFYDWYADLPVASPQVFGDQTDVPESGDWWDATYLMMWGSNVPVTRTPGRALDGRGPLPRHQGRHGQPGLRRQHQVRRRVDAGAGRHRRRAGDGDGPRAPQRVLRRPRGRRSSSTTCAPTPTCRSSSASSPASGDDGALRARASSSPPPTSPPTAAPSDEDAWKTVLLDEATGAAGGAQRLDGVPLRRLRRGPVEPRPRGRRPRRSSAAPATDGRGRSRCCCRPSSSRRHRVGAAPRRARPTRRRPPGHDRLRPDARPVRRRRGRVCRASGRPGTTTSPTPVHPGVAGGDHRRARRAVHPHRPRVRHERRGVQAAAR